MSPVGRLTRRFLTLLVIALVLLLAVELTARVYWRITRGVSIRAPRNVVYAFYPKLERINWFRPEPGDDTFDILMLGGSVMTQAWGNIERALLERATWESGRNVRVHNLSEPGHSSRDSLLKYRWLGDTPFDLVLFYHGINESRANNCPPDLFQADYSHYTWYAVVNPLMQQDHSRTILPFTWAYLKATLRARFGAGAGAGAGAMDRMAQPPEQWLDYGADIKTAKTFRANLEEFAEIAASKEEPLLLTTYVTHVPSDYTEEAFREKRLDYTLHKANLALWGRQENVIAAVAAHNDIVRDVAARNQSVRFVDQDALFEKSGSCFNDVCHFTSAGSDQFVDRLLPVVLAEIQAWAEVD